MRPDLLGLSVVFGHGSSLTCWVGPDSRRAHDPLMTATLGGDRQQPGGDRTAAGVVGAGVAPRPLEGLLRGVPEGSVVTVG